MYGHGDSILQLKAEESHIMTVICNINDTNRYKCGMQNADEWHISNRIY